MLFLTLFWILAMCKIICLLFMLIVILIITIWKIIYDLVHYCIFSTIQIIGASTEMLGMSMKSVLKFVFLVLWNQYFHLLFFYLIFLSDVKIFFQQKQHLYQLFLGHILGKQVVAIHKQAYLLGEQVVLL